MTLAGTAAAPLLLVRPTAKPPKGATLERVTVPTDGVPPFTAAGFRERLETTGGLIVRAAVLVSPPAEAVIVAVVRDPTTAVLIVNVAIVAPSATVTVIGALAAGLSDARLTVNPPACAAALSVTVPVDDAPPVSTAGLTATEVRTTEAGLIVRAAVFVTPAAVVVIVAVVTTPTAVVDTMKVAVVPPATVTLAGTVAAALSLDTPRTKPPGGAGLDRTAVSIDDVPPFNTVGLSETLERTGGLIVSVAVFVTAA
ncbi:MAG: hypothetical protein ABI584_11165, partial [Acidobacteriota bacterium]